MANTPIEAIRKDSNFENTTHARPIAGIYNTNDLEAETLSRGQYLADKLVLILGSWQFIIFQTILLVVWTTLNIIGWLEHWDPYPFILLNLFLSMQAGYAAPIIMMSQNRQNARDRLEAHNDFLINIKAEQEIQSLLQQLATQNEKIDKMQAMLEKLSTRI